MTKKNNLLANILIALVIACRFIPEVGQYTPSFRSFDFNSNDI